MEFTKIRHIIFFGILALISIVFLYMIKPFAYPIFWAAVIAIIFNPLYKKILKYLKFKSLSAGLTIAAIFITLIIPLALVGTLLAAESIDLYNTIGNNKEQIASSFQDITSWIKNIPVATNIQIDNQFWAEKFSDISKAPASLIFTNVKNLTQNSVVFIAMFVLMFYTLFFFLRDGDKMLKYLMHLCPIGDRYEKILYKKFTSTTSATLKGTVVVGIVQGMLGALLFLVTGVDGAFIWGLLMVLASILPPFGTALIWFPAGMFMLATGRVWEGLTILAFGFLVISVIDNFIRPILVGKDTQMHPVIVLFSTLGGLLMFGISGLVVGPVIASLFMTFWDMYDDYFQKELSENNQDGL